jgi:hypothetical protein
MSETPKRKKSTVRHTRAIQRDRTKRPNTQAPDETVEARLEEIVHTATLNQVAHFHDLGLRQRTLNLRVMVAFVLGSCGVSVQKVAKAQVADDSRGDALGVHHGLEGRNMLGQEVLVNAAERSEVGAQGRTSTLTASAVDLASSVAIVITCPFFLAVTDCSVVGVQTGVVAGFVGEEECAL